MPVENGPLAQLAEQVTFNHLVRGSNPLRPTRGRKHRFGGVFLITVPYSVPYSLKRLYKSSVAEPVY
jgi:hypothetical protein